MGIFVKLWWLQSALLVAVLSLADSRQNVLPRSWGQGETWWNNYQPVFGAAQGQPRRYPAVVDQNRRYSDVAGGSRQLSQVNPISVQCQEDKMVVSVQRDLYGTGKLVKPSDLTLGPKLCTASSQSTDITVIFQNGLHDCGNSLQMMQDWLIYSTNLTYNPTPARDSPITRTNSAVVLIQCYYPRHGNVSSNAIKPKWVPFSSTVSMEERLSFSLQLMNDDWSSPRPSTIFHLGDIFHIEATIDVGNHVPMMIFIDSCVATLSPDASSNPSYNIIALNGCLVDGKQPDSSSAFVSPRPEPNKIRFMVDAFRFTNEDASTIYITCNLRAAAIAQTPDPMNKACSFIKTSNAWVPVEGASNICRCCDTGNCVASTGQSRRVGPYYPGGRRNRKREAEPGSSEQENGVATLGPILVVGSDSNRALKVTQESSPLKLWVLMTICFLSLVVLAVCAAVIGKYVLKKQFLPAVHE